MNLKKGQLLTSDKFNELVIDFYEYMDLSGRPGAPTLDKWFVKLQKCLESDVILAFEKMKDTENMKPKNLPKAVKAALCLVWADQGKLTKEWVDYGHCADCNGSGFFRIRYFCKGQNSFAVGIMYCNSCDNYLNYAAESAPRTSAYFLKNLNAMFKPGWAALREGPQAKGAGTVSKIKTLAKNLDNNPAAPKLKEPTRGTGRHLTKTEKDEFVAMFTDPPIGDVA